jgi:hypothetical protein
LSSDGGPACEAIQAAVAKARAPHRTVIRNSPLYSHQSNGTVERAIGEISATVRTIIFQLEDKLGVAIPPTHILMPWIVRHVAWSATRFRVRNRGATSFRLLYDKDYHGELGSFGEQVHYELAGPRGKLEVRWETGTYVGELDTTDEHLVCGQSGCYTARTIRRMPEDDRWNANAVSKMTGTPWEPRPASNPLELVVPRCDYVTAVQQISLLELEPDSRL